MRERRRVSECAREMSERRQFYRNEESEKHLCCCCCCYCLGKGECVNSIWMDEAKKRRTNMTSILDFYLLKNVLVSGLVMSLQPWIIWSADFDLIKVSPSLYMAVFFFFSKWYFQRKLRKTSKCKHMDPFFFVCIIVVRTHKQFTCKSNWFLPILCWIGDHMHNCCNILMHVNAIVGFTWSPNVFMLTQFTQFNPSIEPIYSIRHQCRVSHCVWVNELNWIEIGIEISMSLSTSVHGT